MLQIVKYVIQDTLGLSSLQQTLPANYVPSFTIHVKYALKENSNALNAKTTFQPMIFPAILCYPTDQVVNKLQQKTVEFQLAAISKNALYVSLDTFWTQQQKFAKNAKDT